MNPSGLILKNLVVGFAKKSDKSPNDFDVDMYEDSTRNGNRDGIIVESKSVIPVFIPSLAVFGFVIIVTIKKSVKTILGI